MQFAEHRQDVVSLCRQLSDSGFFAATGGNLMLRADAQHVVVTPSATDYLTMTTEQVCVLRLSDLKQTDGDATPSVESGMHAEIFRKRADIHCSIHTHQPVASALTLINEKPDIPDKFKTLLGTDIPIVPYVPSGTSFLARALGKAVRPDRHTYLLKNHGIVCVGENKQQAMQRLQSLELLAKEYLAALITQSAVSASNRAAQLTYLAKHLRD